MQKCYILTFIKVLRKLRNQIRFISREKIKIKKDPGSNKTFNILQAKFEAIKNALNIKKFLNDSRINITLQTRKTFLIFLWGPSNRSEYLKVEQT